MSHPDWLICPVAHRGLHDVDSGIIENTRTAFDAAIEAGYAFELDVQESADGEAVVFHDDTLDRLTEATGPVAARTAAELAQVPFKATADRIQSLPELLEQVAGRVPMFIEIKSRWNERGPFEKRVGDTVSAYAGPVAVMSFDPHSVAALKARHPNLVRGLIATRFRDDKDWHRLSAARRLAMTHLLPAFALQPHFIAYDIRELPAVAPFVARKVAGLPLLTWTVRTEAQRKTAERSADAIIFERLRP